MNRYRVTARRMLVASRIQRSIVLRTEKTVTAEVVTTLTRHVIAGDCDEAYLEFFNLLGITSDGLGDFCIEVMLDDTNVEGKTQWD